MSASTGSATLDQILRGGYPSGRATLLSGTPGTGKTTLAMQFIQAGLDDGDRCLFVTTEQSIDELRSSLSDFAFDLDAECLDIASLHAARGQSFDDGDSDFVIRSLGDESDGNVDLTFARSFTSDRIFEWFESFDGLDRVVVDSISALELMAADSRTFRRDVLDLVQLLTRSLDATALFTAESDSPASPTGAPTEAIGSDSLQYTFHGVVRLWREQRYGALRRFVDVPKMRGVDHDTRKFEVSFDTDGIDVLPRTPSGSDRPSPRFAESVPTGVPGFDDFLTGGIPTGTPVLFEHDGEANITELLVPVGLRALQADRPVVLVPRVSTSPRLIDRSVGRLDGPVDGIEGLLDAGLYVVDPYDFWPDHDHVFSMGTNIETIEGVLTEIRSQTDNRDLSIIADTGSVSEAIGESELREFRNWIATQYITDGDAMIDVHNPEVMDSDLSAFYRDAALVGVKTFLDETGLQYIRLTQAPIGAVGRVGVVDSIESPPFVRIR